METTWTCIVHVGKVFQTSSDLVSQHSMKLSFVKLIRFWALMKSRACTIFPNSVGTVLCSL